VAGITQFNFRSASKINFIPTRAHVYTEFLQFRTPSGRLKYARWLEASCEQVPKDEWPNGHPPNVNNDEASAVLAKLDLQWLKLE
jgi:hypothetical protein